MALEQLLESFNIPQQLSNPLYKEVNGYFGARILEDTDHGRGLKSCTTWLRCLVKMVKRTDKPHDHGPEFVTTTKGYVWFEMDCFSTWNSSGSSKMLCVDAPEYLRTKLLAALQQEKGCPFSWLDPFASHRHFVDQLIALHDMSIWRVRDLVRDIEKASGVPHSEDTARLLTTDIKNVKSRKNAEQKFEDMHDIARHGLHVTEVLGVTIGTIDALRKYQKSIHARQMEDAPSLEYGHQADEYMAFQIHVLRNLKHRSESTNKRLGNEISLVRRPPCPLYWPWVGLAVFRRIDHVLPARNVHLSMSRLSPLFLLLPGLCPDLEWQSVFSTSFFSFGEGSSEWGVSGMMWLYWATSIPFTVLVMGFYGFSVTPSSRLPFRLPRVSFWRKSAVSRSDITKV